MPMKSPSYPLLACTLTVGLLAGTLAAAQDASSLAMEGKNGWLFGRHEIPLQEKKPTSTRLSVWLYGSTRCWPKKTRFL